MVTAVQPGSCGAPVDEHVFLIGRPPLGEFLGYLQAQTIEGKTATPGELTASWRSANDHIVDLERTEGGFADAPQVSLLSPSLSALRDQVMQDPIAQRAYSMVPTEIAVVELDRIVVFQKQINLEYVKQLREILPSSPTEEELFHFCLPFDRRYDPPVQSARTAQNGWTFVSQSQDFRLLDFVVLDPADITGLQVTGAPASVVGVIVGYGANYLSAVQAEGRLVLNNGSHRAYAAREAGATHVPCLVQQVSRREELAVIMGGEVANQPDLFLKDPRPPVLKDYFDPRLRMVLHVPRTHKQIRVAVSYGEENAPSLS